MASQVDIPDEENEGGVEGSIVEAQIINTILTNRDFSIITSNGLDSSFFPGYETEFKFIEEHIEKYRRIPDETTFLNKFPDFPLFDIDEAEQAMVFAIKESKGYELLAPALREVDELAKSNSIEAAKAMRDKAEEIMQAISLMRFQGGLDMAKDANVRYEEYLRRVALKGQLGSLFGIAPFDKATGGIWENDFVGVLGRPGQGKSWIMEYLLMQPWRHQNKSVLLFSLENPKDVVGYRFDTLLDHFSNFSLMIGSEVTDWEDGRPKRDTEDYHAYILALGEIETRFEVFDSSDSMSGFTIEEILSIADEKKPDIIAIDQLSLIKASKQFRTIRESYIHITRTCRRYVNEKKRPIYLACQAGRDAVKNGKGKETNTPELQHIAESDSVGQDATKIISITQAEGILKVSLKKNTLGRSNLDAIFAWDIDRGVLKATTENEMDDSTNAF